MAPALCACATSYSRPSIARRAAPRHRLLLVATLTASALAGKAEFSSANLFTGVGFDSSKVSWDREFKIRGHRPKLTCNYDSDENPNFLSSVSLCG